MESSIFIIYSSEDNYSSDHQEGWVSAFQKNLRMTLERSYGKKCNPRLLDSNSTDDDDSTLSQLNDQSILIVIYSEAYLSSGWFNKEASLFLERDISLKINHRSRIFKVLKTLVPRHRQGEFMQTQPSYEFPFEKTEDDAGVQYTSAPEQQRRHYSSKLLDLAKAINTILDSVTFRESDEQQPTAYLAEMSDHAKERDIIKRILIDHNYAVLPEQNLPTGTKKAYRDAAKQQMQDAEVIIQLLGSDLGAYVGPKNRKVSAVDIQNELMLNEFDHKRRLFCNMKVRRHKRMHQFVQEFLVRLDQLRYSPDGLIDVLRDIHQLQSEIESYIKNRSNA